MKLIIGLGNPGADYTHTRHNLGWDAVGMSAKGLEVAFVERSRFHAEIAEGRLGGDKLILAHPLTFMNASGEAVQALMQFYHVELQDILIVQDEMDYALGQVAFCAEASAAGHNGISSIQTALGTTNIQRLRLGIGRPSGEMTKEAYVLQRFTDLEQAQVALVLTQAEQAIRTWCQDGITQAMNRWNKR